MQRSLAESGGFGSLVVDSDKITARTSDKYDATERMKPDARET